MVPNPESNNGLCPTVHVVDDSAQQRNTLHKLLESVGLAVAQHATARDFLASYADQPGCLILDVRLRGMSGLELLERRAQLGLHLPILVCTAHGTIRNCVRAMKAGAFDFVEKPADEQVLVELVQSAIQRDADNRQARLRRRLVAERLARLTPREKEVADLIAAGTHNKVICTRLGISRKTLGAHRSNLSKKLEVKSLAELIRLVLTGDDAEVGSTDTLH